MRRASAAWLCAAVATMHGGCASDPEPTFTPFRSGEAETVNAGVRRGSSAYIISREPWTFETFQGEVIETPTYRILTTVKPGVMLDRLPAFVEGAAAAYTRSFGVLPAPRERLETYLMATRPQWARLTQSLMRERASVYLRIQRGGYAADGRGVYFDIGLQDTLAIAAHEGWHQYTQTTFRERLPIWLEEGIAAYMEGYRWDTLQNRATFLGWSNVERYDALRAAREEGKLMPLEALLVSEPSSLLDRAGNDPLVYYAQAWALVHWLREGDSGVHRRALEQLLSDAATGQMGSHVSRQGPAGVGRDRRSRSTATFQAYFDDDLSAASNAYRQFIERITRPGAKDQIVLGKSPLSTR